MLSTLLRRVTVSTLDEVEHRASASSSSTVRAATGVLRRARTVLRLDQVPTTAPLPAWEGRLADRPMWESDRKKLQKWQIDQGIAKEEGAKAEPVAASQAPLVVYYKRGCPHARAAMDLLREREFPFEERDVKGDEATLGWLRIVTKQSSTPQIFLHGEPIGGHEELRLLDQSGELAKRLQAATTPAPTAKKTVRLPVVHPERSPFEDPTALLDPAIAGADQERFAGDELLQKVQEVLAECRPLVQADGGDIELLDIQGDVVHVQLTGNCVGCPSAQATLRQGIERRLLSRLPQLQGLASPQLG